MSRCAQECAHGVPTVCQSQMASFGVRNVVQKGFELFRNGSKCLEMPRNVAKCTNMLWLVPIFFSEMLQNTPKDFEIVKHVPTCSEMLRSNMFRIVKNRSRMSQNVRKCYRHVKKCSGILGMFHTLFRNVPECSEMFRNVRRPLGVWGAACRRQRLWVWVWGSQSHSTFLWIIWHCVSIFGLRVELNLTQDLAFP